MEEFRISPDQYEDPISKGLFDIYNRSAKEDISKIYLPTVRHINTWACVSDYCLADAKNNDIIVFSLIPHSINYEALSFLINSLAKKEIKNTSFVSDEFISFLRNSSILNVCFIVENHKYLHCSTHKKLTENLIYTLNNLKDILIPRWKNETPDLIGYFDDLIKKIKSIIRDLENSKKVPVIKNMFLVTILGSFICADIANETNSKNFLWLSDRDSINEVERYFSTDLFNILFSQKLKMESQCKFMYAPATSKDTEYYSDLVKIPDYLAGTLADYNFASDNCSHEKFTKILKGYFAGNDKNSLVFRINFQNDGRTSVERLGITLKK